jgi:hypothetical protein
MATSLSHPYKKIPFRVQAGKKSSGPEINLRIPVLVAGKKF